MASIPIMVRQTRIAPLWPVARWSAFAAVPILLIWLVVAPNPALTTLWYVAIPILPATFFLNPIIWRAVCPLATLNEWGNRLGVQRIPSTQLAARLTVAGLVLFHVMVPARRFLFNENGPLLAATVVGVGVLALALGAVFVVRSAFCNGLCPVLPIELLYGQEPLVRLGRGRCASCTICTPRGCLDLAPGRAFSQVVGPSRRTNGWLRTPFGVFVAALPGFIVGYGELSDGPLGTWLGVYATTLGASLASYLLVALAVLVFRAESRLIHPLIAALAGGLYYWYAGPAITSHLGQGDWLATAIRSAGIGLVAFWLFSIVTRDRLTTRGSAPNSAR